MRKAAAAIALGLLALSVLTRWAVPPAASGASDLYLTGRVLGRTSRPVIAVWVVVSENGKVRGRSLTGDDGRYFVGKLDRKSYDLVVTRGRQTLIRQQVQLRESMTYDIVVSQ